jgi:hypothetical protein
MKSKNPDPHPHQSEKLNPDPHQSRNFEQVLQIICNSYSQALLTDMGKEYRITFAAVVDVGLEAASRHVQPYLNRLGIS